MSVGVKKKHLLPSNVMTLSLPAPKWGSLTPVNVEVHLLLTCICPGTRPQSMFPVCVVSCKDLNNAGFCSVDSVYRVLLSVILALDPRRRDGVQVEDDPGALLCAVQRPHSSLSPLPKVGT